MMGTPKHYIYTLCCLLITAIMVLITYKKDKETIFKITRAIGLVLIVLEVCKVLINHFIYDEEFYKILPFYYCSLLLYISVPLFFKNEKARSIGLKLIMYFGFIPALSFIFYPITAVNVHPFISFPSLHSMIYHSLMLYLSIILMIKKVVKANIKDVYIYSIVTISMSVIVFFINIIAKTNFMFINYPPEDNTILLLINSVFGNVGYSIAMILGQTLGSFFIYYLISLFVQRKILKEGK